LDTVNLPLNNVDHELASVLCRGYATAIASGATHVEIDHVRLGPCHVRGLPDASSPDQAREAEQLAREALARRMISRRAALAFLTIGGDRENAWLLDILLPASEQAQAPVWLARAAEVGIARVADELDALYPPAA
jgi:hypothetical protein